MADTFTFGHTTPDQTGQWGTKNYILGSKFTSPKTGNVTSMSAFHTKNVNGRSKCAVYDSNFGLIAVSDEVVHGVNADAAWVDYTFSAACSVTAGSDYWLVLWCNATFSFKASTSPDNAKYMSRTYNSFPSVYVGLDWGYEFDIYAEGEEVEPPVPPVAEINPNAFTGYHCFQEQFQKRRGEGKIPYKKPDGTLYRSAPSG